MFKAQKMLEGGFIEVDYFGIKVQIPNDARFLALDNDGSLYSYTGKPYTSVDHWREALPATYIGKIQYRGDWKESLLELS